jgi:flagellar biogenesis protein FliO
MSRLLAALTLCLAVAGAAPPAPASLAAAAPVAVETAGEPALAPSADVLAAAPTSMAWAGARLLGALVVVGALLAVSLVAYRRFVQRAGVRYAVRDAAGDRGGPLGWLARFMPETAADADRVVVLSRSHLGPRESIGVVAVGDARFLLGITGASISLLARLDGAGDAGEPRGPAPFAAELAEATIPRESLTDRSLRAAVSRSRERFARLGGRTLRGQDGRA